MEYTFIDIAFKPLVVMMMHVDSFDDNDDDDVCVEVDSFDSSISRLARNNVTIGRESNGTFQQ